MKPESYSTKRLRICYSDTIFLRSKQEIEAIVPLLFFQKSRADRVTMLLLFGYVIKL